MTELVDFGAVFKALTGNSPLSWQTRLYEQFVANDLPQVIDLPTGLGKTMVMAIWLIARVNNRELPRRLIYVVDRRTVVDQATDLAKKLLGNVLEALPNIGNLTISTLRGQLADNREWTRDPSRPAIVIGTVDLIGSGLLFSGYRSSFKQRPLEAGMLGQDSLLVLDEAHLSKPFEKLIRQIGEGGLFQQDRDNKPCGTPMSVIRMSATSGQLKNEKPPFTLQFDPNGSLTGEDAKDATIADRFGSGSASQPNQFARDAKDATIADRFGAKKRLTIAPLREKEKLTEKLASAAIELAHRADISGKRIVVFVRRPDDAQVIADTIRSYTVESTDNTGPKPKKTRTKPYEKSVEVLTGTMRGLERDKLVEKPDFTGRWLNGELKPDDNANQLPVFLISTSAGEVGFDLNADHMVCDATTIDSLIQRLGRVNRRGYGDAIVLLFVQKDAKADKPLEKAIAKTLELLDGISDVDGFKDVSPKNIAALKSSVKWKAKDEHDKTQFEYACSPEPAMVELTDILLDAWSMTSIRGKMPGRPKVAPWLRGIDEEQSQTSIAWRAELDLVSDHPQPDKALQRIFAKHRIRPHETITLNTGQLLKQLLKLKDRPHDLLRTRVALRLTRGEVVLRSIEELISEPGILYAETTLVFPGGVGGLDSAGMLSTEAVPQSLKAGDLPPRSLDIADEPGYEQDQGMPQRLRIIIERTVYGWTPLPLLNEAVLPDELNLAASYPTSRLLFDAIRDANYRVRLVQALAFNEEDEDARSLVMLAPLGEKSKKKKQLLTEHVVAVETEAKRIAEDLNFDANDPVRLALLFAAKWHDEGKKAEIWQRFAYGSTEEGQWLGKMIVTRDPKSLRRYRHEFGSLLHIHHPERHHTTGCELPIDESTRDLALHLIATHHGAGRPHFNDAIYQSFTNSERDKIHTESIRRFAKLQKKYGHWYLAWLENLLRCADTLASEAVIGAAEDQEDEIEGDWE